MKLPQSPVFAASLLSACLTLGSAAWFSPALADGSGGTGSPVRPVGGGYSGPVGGLPPAPKPKPGGYSGPSTPSAPAGPSGGPKGPATPGAATPSTPSPKTPGSPRTPGPSLGSETDTSQWQFWWYYNSKPYLNLKRAIFVPPVETGGDASGDSGRGGISSLAASSSKVRGEMVPALQELLARAESRELVDAAMISLAKLGDDPQASGPSEIQAALASQLGNSSQLVAEIAALALGILGREEAAPALAHLLEDDEQGRSLRSASAARVEVRTRAYAAYALGLIGSRSPREEVRSYVVSRLCATFERGGEASIDVPVACLLALGIVPLAPDPLWTRGGERLMPSRCREAQLDWAFRVHSDPTVPAWVRAHAPITIARLLRGLPIDAPDRARALESFLAVLAPQSEAEREVKQSSVIALGQIARAQASEPDLTVRKTLMGLSHSISDQQTRMLALVALGQIGGRPGPDSSAALDDIRSYLLRELLEGRTAARPWAAIAIAVLERALDESRLAPSSADMKRALRQTLAGARQPGLMGALCTAIGIAKDPLGAPEILDVLARTQDSEARGHALVALGLIGARESLGTIGSLLTQSKHRPEIVQKAATGLGLMRDSQLVPKLLELLDDNASVTSLGAICFALGRVGDIRGVDALLALARDPRRNNIARGLAAEALGAVADKDVLPWNTELSCNSNYCANPSTLSDPEYPGILDMD